MWDTKVLAGANRREGGWALVFPRTDLRINSMNDPVAMRAQEPQAPATAIRSACESDPAPRLPRNQEGRPEAATTILMMTTSMTTFIEETSCIDQQLRKIFHGISRWRMKMIEGLLKGGETLKKSFFLPSDRK